MDSIPEQDNAANLQELASKSWNLELIISGAAIFLVSYLPGMVDNLLGYYLENLASEPALSKSTLPLLVYSFFKMIAWVLISTFVIHFVLRAFWVGLVGLHAVFPKGIQYDKLPWQTDFSREIGKQNFGQLSDYIHRLDRLSNQIFSFAFLIALMGIGISLLYLVIFLFTNPNAFPEWMGDAKVRTLIFVFIVVILALLPMVAQLISRRPEWLEKPWLRRITTFSIRYVPTLILPFVYRPLTYLNLIYSSNVSRRRFLTALMLVTVLVMTGVMWIFVDAQLGLRGRTPFARQAFFGKNSSPYKLIPSSYDKLRQPGDFLPAVSIESDVLEGPVLRVFVSYRKWLDKSLEQHCTQAELPPGLSKTAMRVLQDSVNLDCLSNFLHLTVNDSVYARADWIFYTHAETGSHGLLGYVPTAGFQTGKNIVSVRIPSLEKPDSLVLYGQVPFWFFGE
jgi:hypothetical protein